VRGPGLWIS